MSDIIWGLTFDTKEDGWEASRGFIKREIPMPVLDEKVNAGDAQSVILRMRYAGMCGTDRGIWNRQVFKDLIHSTLEKEGKTMRILGHEFLGEVVQMGSGVDEMRSGNIKVGSLVSGDSHITCGQCYQCKIGQNNVCTNESILGISTDGIFAQHVKVPARNLFAINTQSIRPEIGAIMDPFGNAVHAVSKFSAKGQTVAVFGTGPIGLFAVALLKNYGASKVIAIDVNESNLAMAKDMGADDIILLDKENNDNTKLVESVKNLTGGVGVDVAMEMAGPLSSVLNCLAVTRRGGQVVLFGIKDGDFTIPKFSQIISKGLTLHGVIGRRIFETWQEAHDLLCDTSNGIQDNIWRVMLKEGKGAVIDFSGYNKETFQKAMAEHPKLIFKF